MYLRTKSVVLSSMVVEIFIEQVHSSVDVSTQNMVQILYIQTGRVQFQQYVWHYSQMSVLTYFEGKKLSKKIRMCQV